MLRGRPIKYDGMALVSTVGSVLVGGKTLKSDLTRTYIKFKLLHSFPTVNGNGMTFTPQNLAMSIGTAVNQPLDFRHQLEGNPHDDVGDPIDGEGKILGSMIRAQTNAKADSPIIPESPFIAEVIGVLWNRTQSARKVIESLGTEEKEYKVSMEAIRNSESDGWYVLRDGEMQYVSSISAEELEKWNSKKYDEVALAVGGVGDDGTTNFWGGAFTLTPADETATIDEVLIASFDNCAIAAMGTSTSGADKPKENKMNLKFKEMIAAIAAGFKAAVSGNDLKLTVGETEYTNPDFYMSGYENGDGTYSVFASLTTKESSTDGMEETRRFEYDGTANTEEMSQVEASEAKVKMPMELLASIKALQESSEETASKYKDYVSKEDADKMVTDAVEAALAKAKEEGDGNMDGETVTKDQASALAKEEVDKAMATRDKEDATQASRCEQIEAGGFNLTSERKEVIAAMPATDEGDKVFKSYLDSLVAGRTEMKKDLKDSGVDIEDEGVQAAMASIDSVKSSGFTAVKAALSGKGGNSFSPNPTSESASNVQSIV